MKSKSVQSLLDDIRLLSEDGYQSVQAVRSLCQQTLGPVEEAVKYGGILFASGGVMFAGVFAYTHHVSVEFSCGAHIVDPYGHLEGKGKGRRHLKLREISDLGDKHLDEYFRLGIAAAGG